MSEETQQLNSKDAADNKVIAAIGYIGILCLIPLLLKKDSKFAQFHARQGLVLFIAEIVVSFVNIIPLLGPMIWFAASVVFFVVSIIGLIKALKGEYWKLPFLHEYAKRINI